jgi:outer membrane receptor protein involved in Fe transport
MSPRLRVSRALVLIGLLPAAVPNALCQQSLPWDEPRFLLAAWTAGSASDASSAPVLQRRVTLNLADVTIDEALKEITRQVDLEISYSPRIVPLERRVSLYVRDVTTAAALAQILSGLHVDVSLTAGGGLALVPQRQRPRVQMSVDTGAVTGRVKDTANGSPIPGATVTVDGARRSALTDAAGRYRVTGLSPNTYIVRARYIGYKPASASVTVEAGEDATADFVLQKSAQELDQVVVTGTIVPTEVKALPTPVTVVSEVEIALQRPRTVQEVFRQAVPTAVSWAIASDPQQTLFSVRGASNLTAGLSQMKVFVDGIEAANAAYTSVDPNSIERIEVIRGPQAAAVYGSDAIGGVIQIFTKRGDPSSAGTQVTGEAAVGTVQTPYAGFRGVLRQDYTGSIRGGQGEVSYNFGAAYSHTDDYIPNGELSAQSKHSVYGGTRLGRGIVGVDLSARYHAWEYGNVVNPLLFQSGFSLVSKPFYQPITNENTTVGVRFSVVPTAWWRNTLTVGIDRRSLEATQTRRRLTTPDDTLFTVSRSIQTKKSIGFNSSIQGSLGPSLSGSLTVGFDHWNLPVDIVSTEGALNTTGAILVAPDQSISATRTVTNNAGYFVQGHLGLREALFLTGGLRAEQNTDFGDELGTPLSPRAGLSYVFQMDAFTLKVRGSWGRAIRAPSPGLKLAIISASSVTLANSNLAPERQQGWDGGVEAAIGSRASMSVTYFHQTAEDLIQQVLLESSSVPTYQAQNVGRVKNTGVEIEGGLSLGPVRLRGQYGYTRSRIVRLAPAYTGALQVGDQSQFVPRHTAGLSATATPLRETTVTAGLSYVGSWEATDLLAFYSCLGGTGPCQSTFRGYTIRYPDLLKVNASVARQISPLLSGFISVDNLTNKEAYEYWNLKPVTGRVATVGLRFQY